MPNPKYPETPETDIAPPEQRPLRPSDTRPYDEGRIEYEDETKYESPTKQPDRVPSGDIAVEGP